MKRSWFNRKPEHKGFKKKTSRLRARRLVRRDAGQATVPSTDHCDQLLAREVKLHRGLVCARCMHTFRIEELDCSHFFNRRKASVRFDPRNVDPLCRPCHQVWEHQKGMQQEYEAHMACKLGDASLQQLRELSRTHVPMDQAKAMFLSRLRGGKLWESRSYLE